MNFVEFCISQGYKAYRKVYNPSSKKWGYIEAFDTTYFSSSAPGYIDIRLIKDGEKKSYMEYLVFIPPKMEIVTKLISAKFIKFELSEDGTEYRASMIAVRPDDIKDGRKRLEAEFVPTKIEYQRI